MSNYAEALLYWVECGKAWKKQLKNGEATVDVTACENCARELAMDIIAKGC